MQPLCVRRGSMPGRSGAASRLLSGCRTCAHKTLASSTISIQRPSPAPDVHGAEQTKTRKTNEHTRNLWIHKETTMSKPMSTRQVRNAVKSLNLVLVNGHDTKINGDFRGSCGFITNAAKTIFVYYDTESSVPIVPRWQDSGSGRKVRPRLYRREERIRGAGKVSRYRKLVLQKQLHTRQGATHLRFLLTYGGKFDILLAIKDPEEHQHKTKKEHYEHTWNLRYQEEQR